MTPTMTLTTEQRATLRSLSQSDFAAVQADLRAAWIAERTAHVAAVADAAEKELGWLRNGAREANGVSSPSRWKAGVARRGRTVGAAAVNGHALPARSPRLRAGAYIGLLTKARRNGSPRALAFARDLRLRWAATGEDEAKRDAVIADGRAAWARMWPGKTEAAFKRRRAAQPRKANPKSVAGRVRAYVAKRSAVTTADVMALFRGAKVKHSAAQALFLLLKGGTIKRTAPGHYVTR